MVFVLGCDHYLQECDLTESNEEVCKIERRTKGRFYELVKEIVSGEEIQFIGEECKPSQKTIPRALATEFKATMPKLICPFEERQKRGIERNYQALGEQERNRVYAIREEYMVERIYSESTLGMHKLIVCGADHIKGLQARLAEHGETLTARDLTKEDWVLEIYRRKEEQLLGPRAKS